jgi:integrase
MTIFKDEKLNKIKIRKGLTTNRMKLYNLVFTHMFELTGKTPSELIEEAKDEEQPYLKNGKIIFKNIEDRKITDYIYSYNHFLHKKKISTSTIDAYISVVRAFYNEYNIELPKPIKQNMIKPLIKEGDIPKIDDVRKAIESTNNIRNKAMILFLASSGMRIGDLIKFKIRDFVEATKEYHNSNNIDELLEMKNTNNIVPIWYFVPAKTEKKGNICITGNTPECVDLLINYLRNRDDISNNMPLFEAENRFMHPNTIITIFQRINDKVFFRKPNGKRFFHAHALRKFFISTCNHNSGDLAKVNLLSGHSNKSSVHDAYNEVNTEVMKRFYTKLIPHLSIRETRVHDVKPKELIKLERESKLKDEAIGDLQRQVSELADKINNIRP